MSPRCATVQCVTIHCGNSTNFSFPAAPAAQRAPPVPSVAHRGLRRDAPRAVEWVPVEWLVPVELVVDDGSSTSSWAASNGRLSDAPLGHLLVVRAPLRTDAAIPAARPIARPLLVITPTPGAFKSSSRSVCHARERGPRLWGSNPRASASRAVQLAPSARQAAMAASSATALAPAPPPPLSPTRHARCQLPSSAAAARGGSCRASGGAAVRVVQNAHPGEETRLRPLDVDDTLARDEPLGSAVDPAVRGSGALAIWPFAALDFALSRLKPNRSGHRADAEVESASAPTPPWLTMLARVQPTKWWASGRCCPAAVCASTASTSSAAPSASPPSR